ncbi:MAG: class I SAM-dependent methyltransferase [Methanosarcinales archaeon]|nr:class I SAM-dependent methyltransferase [Methanosarcinales archaeon]
MKLYVFSNINFALIQFFNSQAELNPLFGQNLLLLLKITTAFSLYNNVTGVDLSPKFLDCARNIAEKAGISEQVSFQEWDMNNLQFDDDTYV